MEKEILLPDLGEGIAEATVSEILVHAGDSVGEGDDLIELVTDKAAFNVPAACAGNIKDILVKEGQTVSIGAPLVLLEETQERGSDV